MRFTTLDMICGIVCGVLLGMAVMALAQHEVSDALDRIHATQVEALR